MVSQWYSQKVEDVVDVDLIAVDSCTNEEVLYLGQQSFELSSKPWRNSNPEIVKPRNYVKMLVQVRLVGLDILGEGVQFPATGKMHLVGCTRSVTREVSAGNLTGYGDYRAEIVKLSEFEAENTYFIWDASEFQKRVTS